jgi:antitoxin MazE
MITHAKQWGNSLALRIPRTVVQQLGLEPNTAIELSVIDGVLCAKPVKKTFPTLEELLAQVPEGTKFEEDDWGKPMGYETW